MLRLLSPPTSPATAPAAPLASGSSDAGDGDDGTEDGFTVVATMWLMAVTLVLVTAFADLFLQRYAQAVIRQATDEGARAWAVSGGTEAACEAAAADVVQDLLPGNLGRDLTITCADTGATITVSADAKLGGLTPLSGTSFATASVVTKELEDDLVAP